MIDPRARVVERGYDAISDDFLEWRDHIVDDPRRVTMFEPEGEVAFHWVLAQR